MPNEETMAALTGSGNPEAGDYLAALPEPPVSARVISLMSKEKIQEIIGQIERNRSRSEVARMQLWQAYQAELAKRQAAQAADAADPDPTPHSEA